MKFKTLYAFFVAVICSFQLYAQELRPEAFDLIDLNRTGMEKTRTLVQEKRYSEAAVSLLEYYRSRTGIYHPDVNLKNVGISAEEQKWADDGLKNVFFVHKGYQPSYFYGEDINWEYWPVKDNELRWQLHRHKWWIPMGKAYKVSGDEKYASVWVRQYLDWMKKNPLLEPTKAEQNTMSRAMLDKLENVRFAWRPMEVSHRLQDQTAQFMYFVGSKHFTPEFLTEFLVNYHVHAQRIMANYSEKGNHLLFEAQRMIYAGALFPEFKNADIWRESGIRILNNEIEVQVYDDGFQYELDPHYHLASINIFIRGLEVADMNGYRKEFSSSYLHKIEKMIEVVMNYSFPNYQNPCFSDAKLSDKPEMLKQYNRWAKIFPQNKQILYMATEGRKGELPSYLSNRFAKSGFYIFRNGWHKDATVMVLKAGPPAFWHNQPDNGTFELYIKGRNFFPDAGSYVFGGDAQVLKERDWFRQTMVHNTLTLNNANIEQTDSKCLLWETGNDIQTLVVENQSYADLKHRRSVFFVENSFFVIVDEAMGAATGDVAVHYQLSEGNVNVNAKKLLLNTLYSDNNNILVQTFGAKGTRMVEEEGWVSYAYRQKNKRPAFSFRTAKDTAAPVRFITVIYPIDKNTPKVSAKFLNKSILDNQVGILLKVNQKKYELKSKW